MPSWLTGLLSWGAWGTGLAMTILAVVTQFLSSLLSGSSSPLIPTS
jgi:hypothetical protein